MPPVQVALLALSVVCCSGLSVLKDVQFSKVQHNRSLNLVGATVHRNSPVPSDPAATFLVPRQGVAVRESSTSPDNFLGHVDTAAGVQRRIFASALLIVVTCYALSAWHILSRHASAEKTPREELAILVATEKPPFTSTPRRGAGQSNGVSPRSTSNDDPPEGFIDMDIGELISETGISGMCLLPASDCSTTSGLPLWVTIYILSLQSLLLQGGLLYFMILQTLPQSSLPPERQRAMELPYGVVFIALYVHFLNTANDIPDSWQLIKHFSDFHHNIWDAIKMGPVLIADSVVIPTLVLFIGAMYICIAKNQTDVVLNSVAVAFVKDIDNWLLDFIARASGFAGTLRACKVRFPANQSTMRQLLLWLIYCPVLPCVLTGSLMWTAMHYFKV